MDAGFIPTATLLAKLMLEKCRSGVKFWQYILMVIKKHVEAESCLYAKQMD
ncbi:MULTISPECIES: hypothetical protein [Legionella]|uniref:hypothetical protein n=1 Tax=Legionella TaxID=445 RepID=UPI0013154C12|nr:MULTISPECIES: hypothetical protein [Legionella]MCP0913452.1 hypothetical protein [Legionella sp. 27cVA30]